MRRALSLVLLLALGACAPAPQPAPIPVPPAPPAPSSAASAAAPEPSTPDAPFRASPPPPSGAVVWTPPKIESWSLPNGIRVLFVERHDLPIVSVRVVATVGAGDVPEARPGAMAFMGSMLEQGAGGRDALHLSDDYEALGAEHGAWCDWDACVARVKVLSSRLDAAVALLADVVLRPTFPLAEIERNRKRLLASLQQEKNSPSAMEWNAIAAAVFGRTHPYGHSLRGTPADVAKGTCPSGQSGACSDSTIPRDDVVRTWRRTFQPGSTAIVVAGDAEADKLRALLAAHFGSWRGGKAERVVPVAPVRGSGGVQRVVLVDAPGAAQSQVYVAAPGSPFATDDRIALGVMNAVLGGMFSSRINLELREGKAYTYGARSGFSMRHGAGPFVAGGAIFVEHTADAARALLAQIARIRDERVTAEELADAKENGKLALPSRFEGVEDIAGALQELAVHRLPLDEYEHRAARIDAVTADDVQRVAKKWLQPGAMCVVVAGVRGKIEGDLGALGPIEVRDAYGDLVK